MQMTQFLSFLHPHFVYELKSVFSRTSMKIDEKEEKQKRAFTWSMLERLSHSQACMHAGTVFMYTFIRPTRQAKCSKNLLWPWSEIFRKIDNYMCALCALSMFFIYYSWLVVLLIMYAQRFTLSQPQHRAFTTLPSFGGSITISMKITALNLH